MTTYRLMDRPQSLRRNALIIAAITLCAIAMIYFWNAGKLFHSAFLVVIFFPILIALAFWWSHLIFSLPVLYYRAVEAINLKDLHSDGSYFEHYALIEYVLRGYRGRKHHRSVLLLKKSAGNVALRLVYKDSTCFISRMEDLRLQGIDYLDDFSGELIAFKNEAAKNHKYVNLGGFSKSFIPESQIISGIRISGWRLFEFWLWSILSFVLTFVVMRCMIVSNIFRV